MAVTPKTQVRDFVKISLQRTTNYVFVLALYQAVQTISSHAEYQLAMYWGALLVLIALLYALNRTWGKGK